MHMLANCTDDRGFVMPFPKALVEDGVVMADPETGLLPPTREPGSADAPGRRLPERLVNE